MDIRFYSILSNYNNDISFILYLNTLVLGYRLRGVWIRSDHKMLVTNKYEFSICVLSDSVQMFTPGDDGLDLPRKNTPRGFPTHRKRDM